MAPKAKTAMAKATKATKATKAPKAKSAVLSKGGLADALATAVELKKSQA